jgi:hypothetical protein
VELHVAHLTAGHREFAVTAARDMTRDGGVTGLVGEDETRLFIAAHEAIEDFVIAGFILNKVWDGIVLLLKATH